MMIIHRNPICFASALFVIALLVAAGCTSAFRSGGDTDVENGRSRSGFSHKAHAGDGAECDSCHVLVMRSDEAGMPHEMLCGFCHETVYDGLPVEELYNKAGWYKAREIDRGRYKEIKLSHRLHMGVGVTCGDCHGDVADSSRVGPGHIPVKKTCLACHGDWNKAGKCQTCHKEIRSGLPPGSHSVTGFKNRHGEVFRDESIRRGNGGGAVPSCRMCHSDDFCINCHQEEPPDNHNNQWRLIGHGITAGINRESCSTCHKTDFCVRCHESTRPRSHASADWGNKVNRHCNSCHMPLNATTCIVCHKEIPSHREVAPSTHNGQWGAPRHAHCARCHLPIAVSVRCRECHVRPTAHIADAPPRPRDLPHRRALMCRACHSSGGPNLKHADNGLECRLCHKL